MHRPPRNAFDQPALIGSHVRRRSVWYYLLLASGVLVVGSFLLGLANAVRGAANQSDT